MRILRAADHRRMRWKNGGGVTTEIAVYPENAGLDAFEWRLSMALVERDGPFSLFPGADRVLAVLEGEGLGLAIDGAPAIDLKPGSPPLSFAADLPAYGSLIGGPVSDLNLMTRRGLRHSMRVTGVKARTRILLEGRWNLCFNPGGSLALKAESTNVELQSFDCLLVPRAIELEVVENSSAHVFEIEIG